MAIAERECTDYKKYMKWFAQYGVEYGVPFKFPQEEVGEEYR